MKIFSRCFSLVLLMLFATIVSAQIPEKTIPADKPDIKQSYGNLPLYFIENNGQVDPKVAYYEKGAGHATYFTKQGVTLSLIRKGNNPPAPPLKKGDDRGFESESIKLSFIGANENPEIIALDEQAGKINYFVGNDQSKWKTNIPTYSSVLYNDIYEGIDIRFYGNNKTLEYDIIVKPGADPNVVRFAYEGIEGLKIVDNGDLEILLTGTVPDLRAELSGAVESGLSPVSKIIQKKPYVYQEIDGKRTEVEGRFVISQSQVPNAQFSYSFSIASYDTTQNLVIDPVLVYSSYLGGGDWDEARGIAIDAYGKAYVAGFTSSTDFPTQGPIYGNQPNYDAFVTKINPAGSALVYSTYLGGGSWDYAYGIALDDALNAYVTGYTYSGNFPTIGAYQDYNAGGTDVFVAKLNPTGSALVYSTYLGGTEYDYGYGIAVNSFNMPYVTGATNSTDFPYTAGTWVQIDNAGGYDAFVAIFDFDGSGLWYSTYMGGSTDDYGHAIAIDSVDDAYVTGYTNSDDFPTTVLAYQTANAGMYDAFVAKFDAEGQSLSYSTYLGGTADDYGLGITSIFSSVGMAVAIGDTAYVTGYTDSTDFPTTAGAYQTANANAGFSDAFVANLDELGETLNYSTYLGGANDDYGYGIALDSLDNAYVTGYSYSTDFPVTSAYQTANAGWSDVFVSKLNSTGESLTYSSYLGGSDYDEGYGIAVDTDGNTYVAGYTDSSNFPTASFDTTYNNNGDAFVAKLTTNAVPALSYSSETGYGTDGLDPETGTGSTTFTYKVVYTDLDDDAPDYVKVHIDGSVPGAAMSLDTDAAPSLQDGDYTNGEQYTYETTLAAGSHDYYFTASDGIDSARLPSTSTLSGPTVSDLEITTTSPLPNGKVGDAYSEFLAATGGTTPYSWGMAGVLPPGLSLDSVSGEIYGTPTTAGPYGFTAEVTDDDGFVYSKIFTLAIDNETTPPTGSIVINNGDTYTNTTAVTVTLACDDALSGCSEMRLADDGPDWGPWVPYVVGDQPFALNNGDGEHNAYAQFKDGVGNISDEYNDTIILDTTAPTGTIIIDGDATYATMTAVTLTLTCDDAGSGCSEMRFSNDGMDWPFGWEAFDTSKSWGLTSGDGLKTVYMQLRDALNNASGSYTDTITLDTTVPTGSIIINNDDIFTTSTSVDLTLTCD
ncbi:MAG: SBBP repeat-containing protein, partial [Deltaproteobacteria bacterium]|nr:SBBP repeat-containing protein [Deltaproteobacteria bacterium]